MVRVGAGVRGPRVGLGVCQARGAGQDVVGPPGPRCGVRGLPAGVRVALVQLHHGGLQSGHLIVLQAERQTAPWGRASCTRGSRYPALHALHLHPAVLLGRRHRTGGGELDPGAPSVSGQSRPGDTSVGLGGPLLKPPGPSPSGASSSLWPWAPSGRPHLPDLPLLQLWYQQPLSPCPVPTSNGDLDLQTPAPVPHPLPNSVPFPQQPAPSDTRYLNTWYLVPTTW